MKRTILLFLLFLAFSFSKAQSIFNIDFYQNLVNQKETNLVLLYLNNCELATQNETILDSIYFYRGKTYFNAKQFKQSVLAFNRINTFSVFYIQSKMYQSIGLLYLDSSENYINNKLKPIKGDSVFNQIKTITLASVALINNNYVVYDSLILQLKDSLFYYNNLQVSLNKWRKKATIKTKNPIIAAGLAAMVPGLGKVYAGKPYDGLSTFLTHVPLGFVVWESYNNAGVNSARFITFTSITSLFYVGNILASYHYIYKNRKEEKIDRKNEILLQCNIMLRNYYN
ncbi:MAG: hypothetical protein ACOYMA_06630 [Bacteroidia bacterium]